MLYTVQITRTVVTEVPVEAASQDEALAAVDKVAFPLPDPAEWSVVKGTYEYMVMGPESAVEGQSAAADPAARAEPRLGEPRTPFDSPAQGCHR